MPKLFLYIILIFHLLACANKVEEEPIPITEITPTDSMDKQEMPTMEGTFKLETDSQAVVTAVSFSGEEENYTFNVELSSPDTGCDQYADWWEVFDKDGQLIYRRILTHSHVNEQPFSRTGGPVKIKADTSVYIRGHVNNLGYGSLVFSGTVKDGFKETSLPIEFAAELAETEPLPTNCAF